LDPLTFRIKEFGFGPYVFNVPFQPPYYQTVLALQDTADIGVDVHFTAGVDVSRNELFWDLRSIDRNTGLPPSSATLGFLKVNDSTGRGEGYLKYLILPKANSRTGDLIQASAEIQFDVNQFINTNVEEHTIDSVPPKTRVLPLASRQDSTSFKIRWTTRDDISGSGLAFKRLYVSKDNQPFELVATLDAQDSLFWFTGVDQSSYGFYLLGVDHTGNQEATKIFAEATTRIASRNLAILQPTAGSSFCSGDSVTIVWDTTGLAFLNISLSFNNGLSFQNIATGISSSLGFYKWRIPQGFTAGSYTFRISDTSNSVQALSGLVNIRSLGLVNLGLDRISCGNPLSLGWNNPQSGFNYLWNNGEVSSSIQVNPNSTTTYWVSISDSNGCVASDSILVYRPRLFAGADMAVCVGTNVQLRSTLNDHPSPNQVSFRWSSINGGFQAYGSQISIQPAVTTEYILLGTDSLEGCIFLDTVRVVVYPNPVVNLGSDVSLTYGDTLHLAPNISLAGPNPVYNWQLLAPINGVLLSTSSTSKMFIATGNPSNPVVQLIALTVISSTGCVGSDTLRIFIVPPSAGRSVSGLVHYPNAISSGIQPGSVVVSGPNGFIQSVPIGPMGYYYVSGLANDRYQLRVDMSKAAGGVTISDAQLINNHVADSILSGIFAHAADVNGDGLIMSNDAQQTARRAADLFVVNSFDHGTGPGTWYSEVGQVNLNGNNAVVNLRAISYGDVNASYGPNIRNSGSLSLIHVPSNENFVGSIAMPIALAQALALGSYQIDLKIPHGYVVRKVSDNLRHGYFLSKTIQGGVRVLWYNTSLDMSVISQGDVLFTLYLDRLDGIPSKDAEVTVEGYHEFNDLQALPHSMVQLTIPRLPKNGNQNLVEFYPNPSTGLVNGKFVIQTKTELTLLLMDLRGKVIKELTNNQSLNPGLHQYDFDLSDLATGQYMIQGMSDQPSMQFVKRIHINR